MTTVAALYVDPKGVYANLPDVEVWDEERDARNYAGPWPVVAHPPCQRWSLMGSCRGYRDGKDGGCFAAALDAVRTYGGVLEHPAHTLAWKTFGLARPWGGMWGVVSDEYGGYTISVDQRFYGHDVNKPTWLYAVGCDLPALNAGRAPRGERTVHDAGGGGRDTRSKTPEPFRDVLLAMARSATRIPA